MRNHFPMQNVLKANSQDVNYLLTSFQGSLLKTRVGKFTKMGQAPQRACMNVFSLNDPSVIGGGRKKFFILYQ
jgi:hypothetical protein